MSRIAIAQDLANTSNRQPDSRGTIVQELPGGEQESAQKMNILLVDDRQENLLALESVLRELGQNIVTARSGRDALKHLLEEDFACILLDVQMPEMNGFETATLIRSRKRS